MPRQARVVVPDRAHHITQRGNNRQDVFFVDGDRVAYLGLLRDQCAKYGVRVLGYCLMTNHVHLVAVPASAEALNFAVGRTHFVYTQYINRLHRRSGDLWQGRFHSCVMDDAYTLAAMRYVERNPVRAKMTRVPWRYRWSSAAAHVSEQDPAGLLDLNGWIELAAGMNWRESLTEPDGKALTLALRRTPKRDVPWRAIRFSANSSTGSDGAYAPCPSAAPRRSNPKGRKVKNRWLSLISPQVSTCFFHSGSHAGVSRLKGTGRKAFGLVCSPVSVSSAPVLPNANFGTCRKWMSGCEYLLVDPENRYREAVFEIVFKAVKGVYCLNDGGLGLDRCLRRVIRTIPILGTGPAQGRLRHCPTNDYPITLSVQMQYGGRPPALPVDFYLSWMSPYFPVFPLPQSPRTDEGKYFLKTSSTDF